MRGMTLMLVLLSLAFAAAQKPEATSLLGKPLVPPAPSVEAKKQLEENLKQAEIVHGRNPDDADAIIWLGRRTAYLGRYREAIEIFSDGVETHPDDARMYRHRGHRYITIRDLDRAIADLSRAASLTAGKPDQIEPDGQPNVRNIPTSTLQSNIYYHLALAHYLKGDFAASLEAWRSCMTYSKNPDMLVATSHWLYMTLRRLGRETEAAEVLKPIETGMDIIENGAYYKLLLMYKGLEKPEALLTTGTLDAVTLGYGVANWHFCNGRKDAAVPLFRRIVEENERQWPAFGYIAAEAELARMK
jgi:tetratricopeptide (TPR) repeat protein